MHKTAAILMLAWMIVLTLTGCGGDKEMIQSDFTILIASTATAENIQSVAEFLDDKIPDVDEDMATHMVIAYREYLLNYITQNKDKTTIQELSVYLDPKTGRVDTEKIQNSELKSFYDQIKAGALMVTLFEGEPILRVDYGKLLEKYGEYISESMKELFQLISGLIDKPTTENATLVISWEELLSRTYAAEKLIRKYPENDHLIEDAAWIYTTHLNTMLMGTTNTPIFDYNTKEFSTSAGTVYREFMLSQPDAVLTWVLKEYYTYLNSINYTLDFNDVTMSKVFFDTCDWLVSEAEKRVKE